VKSRFFPIFSKLHFVAVNVVIYSNICLVALSDNWVESQGKAVHKTQSHAVTSREVLVLSDVRNESRIIQDIAPWK
jgi:hypothetical protein